MRRWKKLLLCVVVLGSLLFSLIYHALLVEPAVKVAMAEETVSVEAVLGREVCLLCRPEQMTGILFVAEAVETPGNTFVGFEDGRELALETVGETPFDKLNEELVLYGKNRFLLWGCLGPENAEGAYPLEVTGWDAVEPVRGMFRVWPFTRAVFSFDYQ